MRSKWNRRRSGGDEITYFFPFRFGPVASRGSVHLCRTQAEATGVVVSVKQSVSLCAYADTWIKTFGITEEHVKVQRTTRAPAYAASPSVAPSDVELADEELEND